MRAPRFVDVSTWFEFVRIAEGEGGVLWSYP